MANNKLCSKQANLLHVLQNFTEFCELHNIKFFIAAGTALGAVKYGGFIPWDDDVDIYITRENFDKLKPLILKSDKFLLKKIFFNDRVLLNDEKFDKDFLDLSVLDRVSESKLIFGLMRYLQKVLRCALYTKIIINQNGLISKLNFIFTYFIGKLIRFFVGKRKIYVLQEMLCRTTVKEDTQNYALLSSDIRYLTVLFPKVWFEETKMIKFQDLILPTTKYLDSYLLQQYGDITITPPESEQVPSHVGNDKYLFDYYEQK